MELIKDKEFGGERPLFTIHDTRLENITITQLGPDYLLEGEVRS